MTKDLLSGFLFLVFGIGAIVIAWSYPLGTASEMGPGYFPMLLGGVLALIGLVTSATAILRPEQSEPVGAWPVRALVLILASVLLFAVLIDRAGLVISVAVLVIGSRLASSEKSSWVDTLLMLLLLCALAVVIFIYGLELPMSVGPWR
jgi:Ca2+/Na+ antiporter